MEEVKKMVTNDLRAAIALLNMLLMDPALLESVCAHIEAYSSEQEKKRKQKKEDEVLLDKPHEEVLKPVV